LHFVPLVVYGRATVSKEMDQTAATSQEPGQMERPPTRGECRSPCPSVSRPHQYEGMAKWKSARCS